MCIRDSPNHLKIDARFGSKIGPRKGIAARRKQSLILRRSACQGNSDGPALASGPSPDQPPRATMMATSTIPISGISKAKRNLAPISRSSTAPRKIRNSTDTRLDRRRARSGLRTNNRGRIGGKVARTTVTVSYTHLDVYKRQRFSWSSSPQMMSAAIVVS